MACGEGPHQPRLLRAQGSGRDFLSKRTGMWVTRASTSEERINESSFSHRAVRRECGLAALQGGPEFLKGGAAAVRVPVNYLPRHTEENVLRWDLPDLALASQRADLSRTVLLPPRLRSADPLAIPSGLSSLTRLQPQGTPDSPLRLLCGVPPLGLGSCCDLCLLHGWAQLTCSGSLVNTGDLLCK